MPSDVTMTGPLFDGRAARAMHDYIPAMVEYIGEQAERMLHDNTAVFKHPTGAYNSRITHTKVSNTRVEVHDGNCVYGPWLEGVGSRNGASRFKGYHLWRKGGQQAQSRADQLANYILRPYLGRMQ